MDWLGPTVFVAAAIGYIVVQRVVRTWIGRRWIEERISNLAAVLLFLLTSAIGLGLLILIGAAILNPSPDALLGLLPLLFIALVVFGFGMTAVNYAAMHGVREHLRAQRERQGQAKDDDAD